MRLIFSAGPRAYAIAFAAVIAAVALRYAFEPWLDGRLPYVTVFGAVALAVWRGGFGPGLMAAVIGFVPTTLLIPSTDTPDALPVGLLIAAFGYAVSTGVILAFGASVRRAHGRLEWEVRERRAGELQAQRATETLHTVVHASPIAILLIDPDEPVVRSWNQAAETLFGWNETEVVGRPIDLAPEAIANDFARFRSKISGGKTFIDLQTEARRKDGSCIDVRLSAAPLRGPDGQVNALLLMFNDATQARRAGDAARLVLESEARVRLASDAARLGIWRWEVSADRAIWENDWPYVIMGMNRSAPPVNGATFFADIVHPDDADAVQRAFTDAIATGGRLDCECRIRRQSDGVQRWVRFTGHRQTDQPEAGPVIVGTIADISDYKDAEERERLAAIDAQVAAKVNAKFRTFFEQGSSFAGVLSLDGTVVEANQLSLDYCGYQRDEIVGHKLWDCAWWQATPELIATMRDAVETARSGRTFHTETPYFHSDGSPRMVDVIISPAKDDFGNVLFIAATGTDITERKRAEDEMRRLAAELSEADRRKTEFLATLAHELRNPLAPLRNGLHLMRLAGDDAGAVQKARDMMERQLTHMLHLVNDLLDIARISGGKLALHRMRVDVRAVVEGAVETSLPLVTSRGHVLEVDLPAEALYIEADAVRIAQVLGNLLHNAAKYTQPPGRIAVAVGTLGNDVRIAVSDTGIGIPAEDLPSIFDMFTQVGRNMDRAEGGLGIGLSLVRRIVELHGGSVSAQSAGHDAGTTIVLRLPLAADSAPVEPAPVAATATAAAPEGLRLLVVDDNRDAAESLALILEFDGHAVALAYDGIEAVERARALRPDAVFLDIGMPGKNGYEVARELRTLSELDATYLVALTGWGAASDRERTRAAGFDAHLTKPAAPEDVDRLLAALRVRAQA